MNGPGKFALSRYLAGTLTSSFVLSITAFLTSAGVVLCVVISGASTFGTSTVSLARLKILFSVTSGLASLSVPTTGCSTVLSASLGFTVVDSTDSGFSVGLVTTFSSTCIFTVSTIGALSNCLSLACASPPPTITKIPLAIAADTTPTLTFLIAHFVKFSDFIKLFFICIFLLLLILYYQNFLFDEYSIPYRY